MKTQSPLLGYNNNVRHKNRVFHIQTEDSGVKHPHIITHLFMDGGRILKSVKRSYAEHVGTEGMSDLVRDLMKDQHKSMLIALRDGQYDHLVEVPESQKSLQAVKSAAAAAPVPAPAQPVASPKAPPVAVSGAGASPAPSPVAKAASIAPPPAQGMDHARASKFPPAARNESVIPSPTISTAARAPFEESPATTRTPGQELTLDIDALERAAKDADTASPLFTPGSDLPPPPKNLFRDKPMTGGYRSMTPPPAESTEKPASQPPSKRTGSNPPRHKSSPAAARSVPPSRGPASSPAPPPSRPPARPEAQPRAVAKPAAPAGGERYAPARPAAIFGQSQSRAQAPNTIFGEDLISDKSLDEVILSYLAEDLEPAEKSKK